VLPPKNMTNFDSQSHASHNANKGVKMSSGLCPDFRQIKTFGGALTPSACIATTPRKMNN